MKKHNYTRQREKIMIGVTPQKTGVLTKSKTVCADIFSVLCSVMW